MIPDAPMPMSLFVEPVLPQYQQTVSEIMRKHGGDYTVGTVFFPEGTIKRFLFPRIRDWRFLVIFPDGYEIVFIQTSEGRNLLGFDPQDFVCSCCHRPLF